MALENVVHLVDPDESIGEALSLLLGTYDILVRSYSDAESFLQAFQMGKATKGCLLITDNLPGASGLSSVRELHEQGFSLPVIIITDTISPGFRAQALRLGAAEVIEKPLMNGFLLQRLGTLLLGATGLTAPDSNDVQLDDDTSVTFRIKCPEDAEIESSFITALSAQSHHSCDCIDTQQISHTSSPGSYVLIAAINEAGREKQVGVAHYLPTDNRGTAEFAIAVADKWQGKGIGTKLLHSLTTAAAIAGVEQLQGRVLHNNTAMRRLAQTQGFSSMPCSRDATMLTIAKSLTFTDKVKA